MVVETSLPSAARFVSALARRGLPPLPRGSRWRVLSSTNALLAAPLLKSPTIGLITDEDTNASTET